MVRAVASAAGVVEAEILFLRRQLALYRERGAKPRRVGGNPSDVDAVVAVALFRLA